MATPTNPNGANSDARDLAEYGRFLDAMESAQVPLSARQYRKAAVYALRLIRLNCTADWLAELCALSPALAQLRENVQTEQGAAAWSPSVRNAVMGARA